MPEPPNASVAIAESPERQNVFLTADGACNARTRSDARRDVDPILPTAADPAGTPIEAGAQDPFRQGNRLARLRRGVYPSTVWAARSAAALAIAVVTAAMFGLALALPDQRPPSAGDGARPATVAPTAGEPLDVPRVPGGAEAAQRRHTPTPRARSHLKPKPRPATRRTPPPRTRTRARPSTPSPVTPPAPSPSLTPAPSPIPVAPEIRRPPSLPAPVPPGAPPEFM
jgi:hypothetical protein